MSLIDAFAVEPFTVNETLIEAFLLEPDQFELWITSTSGNPGSGTICDPYDGSTQILFDKLMASFPPNTTVRLGPGTFLTNGSSGGWTPKSGWRIIGSGFDDTILKLVNATSASALTTAIGADSASFLNCFEALDFTIDCNVGGQSGTAVACGGISISGTHIYIHRIRVINFGTQTASVKGGAILIGNADPSTPEAFDCVIEECIIEQPASNNVRETTCLAIAAKEDANGVMAYHRACVIRDCLIDGTYTDRPVPVPILGITHSGSSTATVTTKIGHGLSTSAWVVITGALESGLASTNYNGSFQVTVLNASQFTYLMPAIPAADPTGEMYVNRVPSQRVEITGVSKAGTGPWTITLTTRTAHNRLPANNVLVNGLTPAACNGPFPIASVPSPTQLAYTLASDPGTVGLTNGSYIGADFRAIEADGGSGTIVENNRINNCTFGYYHDTGSTRDTVIRDNYFRGVNCAIYQKMGGISGGDSSQNPTHLGASVAAIVRSGLVATFTADQPHGFSAGQAVRIAGAKVGGALSPYYNGTFAITSVPSPTQFKYTMTQDPGGNADNSPVPTFGALWQVGRLIAENNVIELLLNVIASGWEPPVGIQLYDSVGSHGLQYIFQQAIVRWNIIRHVDNASDSSAIPLAICLDSCLNAIIENNDINLDATVPVRYYSAGTMKFFNNQSPGGILIQGASCTRSGSYNVPIYTADTLNRYLNELTTDADVSAILTI